MIEVARVVSLIDDKAKVEINGSNSCGSSGSCASSSKGCKTCSSAATKLFEVDNTIGVKVGQQVKIEMKAESYYMGVFLIYGLPLILLLVGIVSGIKIGEMIGAGSSKELIGAFMGIGLWLGAYYIAKLADKKFSLSNKIKYVIADIL